MNNRTVTSLAVGLALAGTSSLVQASVFDIFQLSAFITADEFVSEFNNSNPDFPNPALQDDRIWKGFGAQFNEFGNAGLDVGFTNGLSGGLGTVRWRVTNNSGMDYTNVGFFGFLDGEFDEPRNTFFNEHGGVNGIVLGTAPEAPDSYELDDPFLGDIFDNLLDGGLDDTNSVSETDQWLPEPVGDNDVALALGFELGDLLAGQAVVADFTISDTETVGLFHTDPDSQETIWFNGTASIVSVPEPGTLAALGIGLLGLGAVRRRRP